MLCLACVALALSSCAPVGTDPRPTPPSPVVPTIPAASTPLAQSLSAGEVRAAAFAGGFYPKDPRQLAAQVDGLLAEAVPVADHAAPMAIIVPHAGYVYSGHVAAQAYKQIEGIDYEAIIVLGVNHRDASFRQVSVWAEGAFETPLGRAKIDEDLAAALIAADERILFDRGVHRQEHSVEVQVPFLQRLYGEDLRFVPVVIGEPSPENCSALADALTTVLAGKRALIVASADLSHYPAYDDAVRSDTAILQAIASLDPDQLIATRRQIMAQDIPNLATCSCGEGPVLTAIMAARALGANQCASLRYANSGDTPFAERDQVVGYGALMIWRGAEVELDAGSWGTTHDVLPIAPLGAGEQEALLRLARSTLQRFLTVGDAPIARPVEAGLWQERGVFVTLEVEGELRGCIGELAGRRPLYLSVQRAALSAALADPRFPPLRAEELPQVEIEISALTEFQEVTDVLDIRVGLDGLLISRGDRQGVLLPQVAVAEGWDREEFLQAVCRKAGLPEDAWQDDAVTLHAFGAQVFREQ